MYDDFKVFRVLAAQFQVLIALFYKINLEIGNLLCTNEKKNTCTKMYRLINSS